MDPHSTSKFGLTGMTEGLRQEAEGAGIRVCIVDPDPTKAEVADSMPDPSFQAAMRQHESTKGVMLPEVIAAAIIFVTALPPRAKGTQILIGPNNDVAPM